MADDKAVLLLHGWPGTSDDFHLVRSLLPPEVRVIAPNKVGGLVVTPGYPGIGNRIKWADRLSEYFMDAVLTPVPNCGHFVPLEASETFANAILTSLKIVKIDVKAHTELGVRS